jgi:ATP-binding cassette subfamily F protein uup
MNEPNVLLLDEPTNDLDIETLTELEDLLDGWPGTLVVVSHDRYFLERVADRCVALLGDGRLSMLPGGVDEYLERRAAGAALSARAAAATGAPERAARDEQPAPSGGLSAKELRELQKELNRLERQIDKFGEREAKLHAEMAEAASDFERLGRLDAELREIAAQKEAAEIEWMALAERLEGH